MIRRHPVLDAVVIALVLLGIAIVIGVTTGDDPDDAAVERSTASAARLFSDASSSAADATAYDIVLNNQALDSRTEMWLDSLDAHCVTLAADPPSLLPSNRQRVVSVTPTPDCKPSPRLVMTYNLRPHGGENFGQAVVTVTSFARAGTLPACEISKPLGCDSIPYQFLAAEVKVHD
jgi:hypothetical protein